MSVWFFNSENFFFFANLASLCSFSHLLGVWCIFKLILSIFVTINLFNCSFLHFFVLQLFAILTVLLTFCGNDLELFCRQGKNFDEELKLPNENKTQTQAVCRVLFLVINVCIVPVYFFAASFENPTRLYIQCVHSFLKSLK